MAEEWPAGLLVAAAQRGDPAAITDLVSGSHPHVRRFAFSLCSSPEDAEDAAQEALIILFQRIGTLRASAALASWIFRIVANECVKRTRAAFRNVPMPIELEDESASSLEDDLLVRLEAERVAAVIAALPPAQCRVLIMRDVQGYSGREVARAMGLSLPAMKSLLHRARAVVHERLAPEHATTGESR